MHNEIIETLPEEVKEQYLYEIEQLKFTKDFRSSTAEEWFLFLPSYKEPKSDGAFGKAIVHYDLMGTKEITINTSIIIEDPKLFDREHHVLIYLIGDEVINRIVGFANTLLTVYAGENSYKAEYKS
ncbi:hypothetical protein [Alkalibacillus haloalkaliphilus]|uniref:hypothetical protein n=1 Tax=Alkalibacillus haloalkaliphilus TaxID=94136 RepID=UPI0029368F57|nr:hypothetical protein [Alkalibacillus haloalkaliphilus]MDV2580743.1 hypothetical protein [Alkalibacillus haloalkaliphilus]